MAKTDRHPAAWLALGAIALLAGIAGSWLVLSLSDPTRVIWARRLGVFVWWLGTGLSLLVLTSIAILLVAVLLPAHWRSRFGNFGEREGSLPPASASGDDRRAAWLRRCWFASLILWFTLEAVGGVWMASGVIGRRQSENAGLPQQTSSGTDRHRLLPVKLPPKKEGTFVLVTMGGSTAGGDPYSPTEGLLYKPGFSFLEAAGRRLQEQHPQLQVHSLKLALGGGTLQTAAKMLGDLPVHPDVLVIYSGHNELFTRFSPDREVDVGSESIAPSVKNTHGWFPPSLIARCVETQLNRIAPSAVPPSQQRRRLFDRPLFTQAEAEQISANFHDLLDKIVRFCREHEIEPILIIPASNESGFDPSRSWLPADFPGERQRELEAIYKHLDSGRLTDAQRVELLEAAFELAPTFAETCFRLGKEYERLGRYSEARQCYQAAIDHDGYPLRAPSRIADIYRNVAGKHDSPLIDARDVLRPLSSHGILGDELIHDNCHPNMRGYAALANAVLGVLKQRGLPAGKKTGPTEPLTADDLIRYFSIDRQKWIEVFRFVGRDFTDNLSRLRYDNSHRLEKGRAYERAATRIAAGEYPFLNGVPDTRVLSPGSNLNRDEP